MQLTPRKFGKAQAREQFSPLVESLAAKGGVVEITDYGKTAAVLLGYKDYLCLMAQAAVSAKPLRQLRGSGVLVADLEDIGKKISKTITDSVASTIAKS
jgi:prevent-host-death family protein